MKSVIAVIMLVSFAIAAYAGTTTSTNAAFSEGSCFEKNEYCEFTDFRGQSHEYWFGSSIKPTEESLYQSVDFYVGKLGSGISCDGGLCTNDKNEVVGLDPKWPPFTSAFAKEKASAPAEQPVQQATTIPYKLGMLEGNPYSGNPLEQSPRLQVISLVKGLIVEKVNINEGECVTWINPASGKNKISRMGEAINIAIFHCTLVKVDVTTNMGSWTHTF